MIKFLLLLILVYTLLFSDKSIAQDNQLLKGIGNDKVCHFWAGFFTSGLTSIVVYDQKRLNKNQRIAIAIGSAFAIGLAKELYDVSKNRACFDISDLGATVLGATPVVITISLSGKKKRRR